MLGEVADMRSVKMVNRKRRGKKWNRAAQAARERAERAKAEREQAERAKAERAEAEAKRQAAVEDEQFMAQLRELEEQVRDVDYERPLPRRERSILTRENLRIADELAGVSRPLAGCSACLLVVLVVAVVCAVLSFFV